MERRTMRKKPGMLKRTMVSILSLVMLLSLVSPGFYAGAQESETTAPTVAETDAAVVPEANDVETLDNTSNVGEESTVVEGSEEDEAAAPAEENTSDVGEEETTSEDTVPETTETEAVEEDTTEGAAEEETTSDETVTDESADNTADVGEEGIAPEEGAASNDTMNDKMNDRPGEGSGMMGNELDVSYFRTTPSVMYDIFTAETDSSGEITGGEQASNNVQPKMTVTLNGLAVEWNYSGDSSNATTTNTLGDYFPTATTSAAGTADLEITPPDGYYVSAIVVACTSSGNSGPYDCNTWAEGNAYNGTFSYDGMGEFVLEDFSSLNFSHMSSSNNSSNHYFILIELSPIPTPLYVEYNYGLIVDHMTAAGLYSEYTDEFTKNAYWTTASSYNFL